MRTNRPRLDRSRGNRTHSNSRDSREIRFFLIILRLPSGVAISEFRTSGLSERIETRLLIIYRIVNRVCHYRRNIRIIVSISELIKIIAVIEEAWCMPQRIIIQSLINYVECSLQ